MKNKFKKSKIIVPALALITATTVASVTGTVAWFTANRAITVNASNFIATKLESKLSVTTEGRIGTAASNSNTAITTTVDGYTNKLTHGSYDAKAITSTAAGNLYVAQVSDDGTSITEFSNLGTEATAKVSTPTTTSTKWLARTDSTSKVNIWYGVSWTMTFKLDAASSNVSDYLFLDVKGSTFKDNSGENLTTANGFRIAFMTAEKFKVLGGDDTVTHVGANTTGGETVTYEVYVKDTNYFVAGSDVAKVSDVTISAGGKEETLSNSAYCLGEVGYVDTDNDVDNSLTITCVAWYEGSDDYVANENNEKPIEMSNISADLSFYTRAVIA